MALCLYLMRESDAPLYTQAAENTDVSPTKIRKHVELRPGKYIMNKARNASECMINKKHGAGGWAGGGETAAAAAVCSR